MKNTKSMIIDLEFEEVMESMFDRAMQFCADIMTNDVETKKQVIKIEENYNQILSCTNNEDKNKIERLLISIEDLYSRIALLEDRELFEYAFKLGAKFSRNIYK